MGLIPVDMNQLTGGFNPQNIVPEKKKTVETAHIVLLIDMYRRMVCQEICVIISSTSFVDMYIL